MSVYRYPFCRFYMSLYIGIQARTLLFCCGGLLSVNENVPSVIILYLYCGKFSANPAWSSIFPMMQFYVVGTISEVNSFKPLCIMSVGTYFFYFNISRFVLEYSRNRMDSPASPRLRNPPAHRMDSPCAQPTTPPARSPKMARLRLEMAKVFEILHNYCCLFSGPKKGQKTRQICLLWFRFQFFKWLRCTPNFIWFKTN